MEEKFMAMAGALLWLARILLTSLLIVIVMAGPSLAHHSEKHNAKKQEHACTNEDEKDEEASESSEACEEEDGDSEESSGGEEGDEDEKSDEQESEFSESEEQGGSSDNGDSADEETTSNSKEKSGADVGSRGEPGPALKKKQLSDSDATNPRQFRVTAPGAALGADRVVRPQANALDFVITADTEAVRLGDTVTYTITATNTGSELLTGLRILASILDRTDYIEGSASGGGVYDADALTWEIPEIAAGAGVGVMFQVKVGTHDSGADSIQVLATADTDQLGAQEARVQTSIIDTEGGQTDSTRDSAERILPRTGGDPTALVLLGVWLVALGMKLITATASSQPSAG